MRRPGRPSDIPPPLELACLRALWQLGEGSVKDVRSLVTSNRNLAYTTVMTVLERLARRGAVERRKRGRAFLYKPVMGREQARRLAVKELAETYFDGSVDELRRYLDRPGASHSPQAPPPPVDEPADADMDTTLL